MAIASILLGIVSGIVGFVFALLTGQGLLIAFGVYVLAGMIGMAATLAVALMVVARPCDDASMVGSISRA